MDKVNKLLEENGIKCNGNAISKKDLKKAIEVITRYFEASPQNVLDTEFSLNKESQNLAQYIKLMKKPNKKLIKTIDEYEVYASDRHVFMINTSEDAEVKLVYMVQFEFNNINGLNCVSQIKLWRTSLDTKVTSMRVGKMMFFEAIMPLADGIASDNAQTSAGRKFWQDRIAESFQQGFNIYIADQNKKTFAKLENAKDLENKEDLIWGESRKMKGVRLVITKKELDTESTNTKGPVKAPSKK